MPSAWRFGDMGELDPGAVNEFYHLILKIAAQGQTWSVIELFKSRFGGTSQSSSEDWAKSDLHGYMHSAANNAPSFIDAFWSGCQEISLMFSGISTPDETVVNRILADFGEPFEVRPPKLISRGQIPRPDISVPETNLDTSAKALIQQALLQADEFLLAQKPRQAVQEILWLLETVSTAFEGRESEVGTVEGKYFNTIVRDLRRHNKDTAFSEVLGWISKLHGFLSSPTGGGIRHGMNLAEGKHIDANEALLFCNLTKSYIGFLLTKLDDK